MESMRARLLASALMFAVALPACAWRYKVYDLGAPLGDSRQPDPWMAGAEHIDNGERRPVWIKLGANVREIHRGMGRWV